MGFWEILWAYGLVFLFAAIPFVELIVVIPIATLAGLHLLPVTIMAFLGNVVAVLVVIVFMDHIKKWLSKRKGQTETNNESESKRVKRARKLWKKYGLPGLAIVGPVLVGSHLTAFMSLSFGGEKRTTTFWIISSLVIWCTLTAVFTYFGVDFFNMGTGAESFIGKYFKFD